MRAAVIVSGVLGAGCAIVFAAAALTATLFPNGTLVSGGWNGNAGFDKGFRGGMAAPVPAFQAFPIGAVGPDGSTIINADGSGGVVARIPEVAPTDQPSDVGGGASTP
jgi:hypothetical protein